MTPTATSAPGARAVRGGIVAVVLLASAACAPNAGVAARVAGARPGDVVVTRDRPPLAIVLRDGDPRGAVAAAVTTSGIAPERGAEPAVALAAAIEARLEAKGIRDVTAVGGWDGYRVRALVASEADGAALVDALRSAMLTPMDGDAVALASAKKRVAALAHRPLPDPALLESAKCMGDAFGIAKTTDGPSAAELEAWRRSAHGLGRVAVATAGADKLAQSIGSALASGEAWPRATALTPDAWPDARLEIYDATGTATAGGARATLSARTSTAARAVGVAAALGDPRGPLASRLGALDGPARVRDVTATAHPFGGCVAVTIELGARDLAGDFSGRVATAVALARQEIAVEVGEAPGDAAAARDAAARAGDPRDAAERAAWWTLSAPRDGATTTFSTAIGLASGRDTAPGDALAARAQAIRADLDRATVAWHSPVVEARTRVERGQGELWLVVASPCGTVVEVDGDAGVGAAVALAAADRAARSRAAGDAEAEPWVAPDGLGLVVHGAAARGESPAAHARRLADLAARSLAADPLDAAAIGAARGWLLGRGGAREARVLGALGSALAPGHPSWIAPWGTADGVGRASDEAIALRASALRAGPLRVAVVANADAAQADAAAQAADRWIARRPGEARACAAGAAPIARPGTYAVDLEPGASSEATLALALPTGDDARRAALLLAAALDGADGLLARALGDGNLARSWSAAVLGAPRAPSLVVRVVAPNAQLDAAVAQTRALFDRLQKNGITEQERTRASELRARADLAAALDPRARLLALWRGERAGAPPTADALRAFAASVLRDDALVIVAARPARSKGP